MRAAGSSARGAHEEFPFPHRNAICDEEKL
jgi:hypothetical protein